MTQSVIVARRELASYRPELEEAPPAAAEQSVASG
jgi:hypothetical protein